MQLLVVEYARNVAMLKNAHTTEINPKSPHPVIDIMEHQKKLMKEENYGGSMRLGAYPCALAKDTIAHESYAKDGWIKAGKISERHRHRFEVNPKYVKRLVDAGLVFSGTSPDGKLMEIAELSKDVHPFFVGTQFHPEFLARPLRPHPLFSAFVREATKYSKKLLIEVFHDPVRKGEGKGF